LQSSKKNRVILIVSALFIVVILAIAYLREHAKIIDAATAENLIENSLVTDAVIDGPYLYFKSGNTLYKVPKDGVDLKKVYNSTAVTIEEENPYIADIITIAVLILMVLYLLRWARRNRELKEQQVNEQLQLASELQKPADIRPIISDVTFSDVAGIDDVKEELEEIIDFLKKPLKYRNFGIRMPRGVLLVGPPGVGKTLIAKAVAGEAGVPFFYQSGASFVQIYVGMGAKRVRELFKKAKTMAPAIVFIDEIDAVGKARGGFRNDEREATLNQLLTEMDGFEDSSGVIVIAATNKIEMLDDALLRPGRFDRRIFVSLPNKKERKSILKIYLSNKPYSLDLDEVAEMSVGFSGAALSSLVNEAAIHALNSGKDIIEIDDFLAVKDKVLLGKRKILTYSSEEKRIQAIYQAAKAVAAYWLDVEFEKIGLLSDYFKTSEKEIISKTELMNRIKVYLAGDLMMKLYFNEQFSNAARDLKEARVLAQDMVELFGMGDDKLAPLSQVEKILDDAKGEIKKLLVQMQDVVVKLSEEILKREVVTKDDVRHFLNDLF